MSDEGGDRAALYCRVSTEDQAKEGFSLTAQKERLEAYCMAKGWTVSKVYIDDGYSGRKDDRPAYIQMMVEKEKWDILVVLKMDRIHRNSKNFTLMMEQLHDWDKEFTSMQESFDTTTAMGRFVMDIIQRIAQLESEQIGERVYIGMMQKAKEGKGILGFNTPYGFEFREGDLVLNEDESGVVITMFNMYYNGETLRGICRELKELGIQTKRGMKEWDPKTVQRILSNPLYCGYLKWEDIIYSSDIGGIIDDKLFNLVQERLHRNRVHVEIDDEKGPILVGET